MVIARVNQKVVVRSIEEKNDEAATRVVKNEEFQLDHHTCKQLYTVEKKQAEKLVYTRVSYCETARILEKIFTVSKEIVRATFIRGPETIRHFHEYRRPNEHVKTMTQVEREEHLGRMLAKFEIAAREKVGKGKTKGGKDSDKNSAQ